MADIAIIGAGMAGLSALQRLAAAGHQVTLFEKSRGSGGRMASKRLDDLSWDMGAQTLIAQDPAFAGQLQQWQQDGWVEPWPVLPHRLCDGQIEPAPDTIRRYTGTPRMTALSRALLQPAAAFITATRIVSVHWQQRQCWLHSDSGDTYGPFAGLIITTPPQQALPLVSGQEELRRLCASISMLPCWTLLLSSATPLPLPDYLVAEEGPLGLVIRNSSKPWRDAAETWVIQASQGWSQLHADSPREAVQRTLLQAFRALGTPPDWTPATQWLHRWLYATPAQALTLGALAAPDLPLLLGGDWCHSPSLEGAWLSGQHAAARLLPQLT